jgi:hypothetical protein
VKYFISCVVDVSCRPTSSVFGIANQRSQAEITNNSRKITRDFTQEGYYAICKPMLGSKGHLIACIQPADYTSEHIRYALKQTSNWCGKMERLPRALCNNWPVWVRWLALRRRLGKEKLNKAKILPKLSSALFDQCLATFQPRSHNFCFIWYAIPNSVGAKLSRNPQFFLSESEDSTQVLTSWGLTQANR